MNTLLIVIFLLGGCMANMGVIILLTSGEDTWAAGLTDVVLGLGMVFLVAIVGQALEMPQRAERNDEPDQSMVRTPVVNGLTVWSGPGEEYERAVSISHVYRGDRLRVVEDSVGWIRFRIRFFDPNWSGWVRKRFTTTWDFYQELKRIEVARSDYEREQRNR